MPEPEALPRELSRFAKDVEKALSSLNEQAKILSLGIDYRGYVRFQWLTPPAHLMMGGVHFGIPWLFPRIAQRERPVVKEKRISKALIPTKKLRKGRLPCVLR